MPIIPVCWIFIGQSDYSTRPIGSLTVFEQNSYWSYDKLRSKEKRIEAHREQHKVKNMSPSNLIHINHIRIRGYHGDEVYRCTFACPLHLGLLVITSPSVQRQEECSERCSEEIL